jgi:hypothetical protein
MTGAMMYPLPVKADRELLARKLAAAYDATEAISFKIDTEFDPADETREVTAEHVAELATMIDMLDIEVRQLADGLEVLRRCLSYLVMARLEQEGQDG